MAELERALAVADLAVIVVSATDGVQVQTEDAWRARWPRGMPRVIVVNKLDRERADFDRAAGRDPAAPSGRGRPGRAADRLGSRVPGVVDLLDDTATLYDRRPRPRSRAGGPTVPAELSDEEHAVHEQLVEGIVVGDDDLMARYLEGETIDRDELEASACRRRRVGSGVPGLCCSGDHGLGVDRLARLLRSWRRRPAAGARCTVLAGGRRATSRCDPDGAPAAVRLQDAVDPTPARSRSASGLRHDQARRRAVQPPHPGRGAPARARAHPRAHDARR